MSLLSRFFPQQSKNLISINDDHIHQASSVEDQRRFIFYSIAHQHPHKIQNYDHQSLSERRLLQVRRYEEMGAIGLCAAYVAKSPLFRSHITKNFYVGLSLHMASSVAVFCLSRSFIRTYIEPRFVAKDDLVGELAEKYNFTIEDWFQAKEEQINEGAHSLVEKMKKLL